MVDRSGAKAHSLWSSIPPEPKVILFESFRLYSQLNFLHTFTYFQSWELLEDTRIIVYLLILSISIENYIQYWYSITNTQLTFFHICIFDFSDEVEVSWEAGLLVQIRQVQFQIIFPIVFFSWSPWCIHQSTIILSLRHDSKITNVALVYCLLQKFLKLNLGNLMSFFSVHCIVLINFRFP